MDKDQAAFERMAEAQASTDERLASLTERIDRLAEAQARNDARLAEFEQRTEERFASLTARIDRLAEAQARTDARLAEFEQRTEDRFAQLAEAQARTDARLAEFEQRTEERFAQLASAVAELQLAVAELVTSHSRLEKSVEDLRGRFLGSELERRYQQNAPAYFGPIARGLRLVDKYALADMLDDSGILETERREVLAADLVLTGQRREDRRAIYLLVEISVGMGRHGVERADKRAHMLGEAIARLHGEQTPVVAIVAGESIDAAGRTLARQRGVWQVADGRVTPPAV